MDNIAEVAVPKEVSKIVDYDYQNYRIELLRLSGMIEHLPAGMSKNGTTDIAMKIVYPYPDESNAPVDWIVDLPDKSAKYDFYTDFIHQFFVLCTDFESHGDIHSSEELKGPDKIKSIEFQREIVTRFNEIVDVIDGEVVIKEDKQDEFRVMSEVFKFFEKTRDFVKEGNGFEWQAGKSIGTLLSGIQNDITTSILLRASGLTPIDSEKEDDSRFDIDVLYESNGNIFALDITGKAPEKIYGPGFDYFKSRRKGYGLNAKQNIDRDNDLKKARGWKSIGYLVFGPKSEYRKQYYNNDHNKAVLGWPSKQMIKDFNKVVER